MSHQRLLTQILNFVSLEVLELIPQELFPDVHLETIEDADVRIFPTSELNVNSRGTRTTVTGIKLVHVSNTLKHLTILAHACDSLKPLGMRGYTLNKVYVKYVCHVHRPTKKRLKPEKLKVPLETSPACKLSTYSRKVP
ncbi:hypothetical protein EMCG_04848 [[Emmonsia] crescens]|uniref:Uncharacterized protein n=1 Tax=[Emmonsia] crescens TaxID=73230 RepID=A0A0G2IYD5_9EURO|nr:hypothetical protein EMCG_04848 [Emmonsia crescens UAMH 3008]